MRPLPPLPPRVRLSSLLIPGLTPGIARNDACSHANVNIDLILK